VFRVRRRAEPKDDPTIIRHLHDLAALEPALESAAKFRELVLAAVAADVGRGGEKNPPTDPALIFADMLKRLESDPPGIRGFRGRGVVRGTPRDDRLSRSARFRSAACRCHLTRAMLREAVWAQGRTALSNLDERLVRNVSLY
jgi:hypothetical protein